MHNRRFFVILAMMILTFALVCPVHAASTPATAPAPAPAAKPVRLNVKKTKIVKGKTKKLSVKGTYKKVTWKSSNKAIVTVNKKGKITGKKAGVATITAKVDNKKKLKCKVYVKGINRNRITMHKGLKYKLKVKNGQKGTGWKSSNSKIAKVAYDGTVTAGSSGIAYISCRSGKTKLKCKILVAKLNKSSIDLNQGGSYTLIRTGSDAECKWSTSDPTVATVNKDGDVYAIAGGTAVIKCECGSAKLECNVFVKGNNIITQKKLIGPSKASRYTVTINGAYGNIDYTIYNQGSSINKSKIKEKKRFMPHHGCAASATSAVLGGLIGRQVTPVEMIETIEPLVFGENSWNNNYNRAYNKQLPLSLNGITKIFTYHGISTKYVRTFTDSAARAEIVRHLKSGQPVIFVVSKKNRFTGKSSSKWTNSYHTMAMLGITDSGKVIVADSVNRSSFGSWQRIKLAGINEVLGHMFPCKKVKDTNYWGGAKSSGGYVLVYVRKNLEPLVNTEDPSNQQPVTEQPGENPEEDPAYIPPTN